MLYSSCLVDEEIEVSADGLHATLGLGPVRVLPLSRRSLCSEYTPNDTFQLAPLIVTKDSNPTHLLCSIPPRLTFLEVIPIIALVLQTGPFHPHPSGSVCIHHEHARLG